MNFRQKQSMIKPAGSNMKQVQSLKLDTGNEKGIQYFNEHFKEKDLKIENNETEEDEDFWEEEK